MWKMISKKQCQSMFPNSSGWNVHSIKKHKSTFRTGAKSMLMNAVLGLIICGNYIA